MIWTIKIASTTVPSNLTHATVNAQTEIRLKKDNKNPINNLTQIQITEEVITMTITMMTDIHKCHLTCSKV